MVLLNGFLLEYAVMHAAYLRERAPTRPLREFGIPVYILLQGQKEAPKLQPRSKRYLFVGYDDGSRNFRFLDNLPTSPSAPELVLVDPVVPREGEYARGGDNVTQQPGSVQPANKPGNVQL